MSIFTRRHDAYKPSTSEDDERARELAAERAKVPFALEAVRASQESVHTEARRLRDSRQVAADLREQIRKNGFTERMAASFALREKGK